MTQNILRLKNAPIVEAVLDIECDFAPGHLLGKLEAPARDRLSDRYPVTQVQFVQEVQFEANVGGPVNHSMRQDVQAFQFLQQDGRQLVQVRTAGYSFNRLAPYGSFDEYLPEVKRTWNIYRELASPVQIRSVRLRYINRLILPMTDGQIQLDPFLRIGPRLPDEEKLTFVGFLNQYTAVEKDTGHHITTVLTAQRPEGDKLPVIFDNTVAVVGEAADPGDWDWLEAKLQSLRGLKNRVFKNTLSEECLNLFQ